MHQSNNPLQQKESDVKEIYMGVSSKDCTNNIQFKISKSAS